MKKEKDFDAARLVELVQTDYSVKGDPSRVCSHPRSIDDADEHSLVWISPDNPDRQSLAETTPARIIVCDESIKTEHLLEQKTFIIVADPRLAFIRILTHFYSDNSPAGVHPTAVIHPEARISKGCYIGPFTYIGKCVLGDSCRIMGQVFLYDGVTIGSRVTIHAGSVIGTDGFGYQRNEIGELEKFPHIGGVLIEDDVEIGAGTCIDRGTLGNTTIMRGTKIDNLVHIGHNVTIGRDVAVIAHSMIGGGTRIGNRSWIAPLACIRDRITIGENTTVGMGAVVVRNVSDGDIVYGVPAKSKDP